MGRHSPYMVVTLIVINVAGTGRGEAGQGCVWLSISPSGERREV